MKIEQYDPKYCKAITNLFFESVHAIDSDLYTQEQKQVWAPMPPDYEQWQRRLDVKKPFVAVIDQEVAGFIEFESDGHIDCLYVRPDFQRLGVGLRLVSTIIQLGKKQGINRLHVEASKVARPLFNKLGFCQMKENLIKKQGVEFINYSMELRLN